MSVRWRRNQRLKCVCGGYHFPHRKGGGACEHSKTSAYWRAQRAKDATQAAVEAASLFLSGLAPHLFNPPDQEIPF